MTIGLIYLGAFLTIAGLCIAYLYGESITHFVVNLIFAILFGAGAFFSLVIAIIITLVSLDFIVRSWHEAKLSAIRAEFLSAHPGWLGVIARDLLRTTDVDGSKCLEESGAVIASTALMLTAGTMIVNRVFAKNAEVVETVRWCHQRYYEIADKFPAKPTADDYGRLAEFYHCEHHFYVRGLLPTDLYAVWMDSWRKRCHIAAQFQGFNNAVAGINDEDFGYFYEQLMTNPKSSRDIALDDRREWQRERYGLIGRIARYIDQEHRSGGRGREKFWAQMGRKFSELGSSFKRKPAEAPKDEDAA